MRSSLLLRALKKVRYIHINTHFPIASHRTLTEYYHHEKDNSNEKNIN